MFCGRSDTETGAGTLGGAVSMPPAVWASSRYPAKVIPFRPRRNKPPRAPRAPKRPSPIMWWIVAIVALSLLWPYLMPLGR